jgi:hypothetical protein
VGGGDRYAFRLFQICLSAALLLLYCCFTAALLLLYCCFTAALLLSFGSSERLCPALEEALPRGSKLLLVYEALSY